jgi:hypothetical protein
MFKGQTSFATIPTIAADSGDVAIIPLMGEVENSSTP